MKITNLNPFKRNNMEKLTTELAALTMRRDRLITKQIAARSLHDRALDARRKYKLEGDIDDATLNDKRDAAVNSAACALEGFTEPLAGLANSISEKETQLAVATLIVNQKAGAEKYAKKTDTLENKLGPWLELTREFIAAHDDVGVLHYEGQQIAGYLRGICGEVEMADEMLLKNLRASVTNMATGLAPIPNEPAIEVPIVAAPSPPTQQVFTLHAVTWLDHAGMQRVLSKWHDATLPIPAAAFALSAKLAVPVDDPGVGKLRGQSAGHPRSDWLNNLDTEIGPDIAGSQSARVTDAATAPTPFIRPRERNVPYVIQHREAKS
jgi:hypothetical protein